MRITNVKRIKKNEHYTTRWKRKMGRSQNQAELSEVEKIKEFITSCGFKGVSDSSSHNKIYSKNGTVIVIRENTYTPGGDLWEK
jgi:hypothetical protein